MYFPQATGFVRMTWARIAATSSWAFPKAMSSCKAPIRITARVCDRRESRHRARRGDTLEDAKLKDKHVGIVAGTPPATNMAIGGTDGHAKPYPLMIDTRVR